MAGAFLWSPMRAFSGCKGRGTWQIPSPATLGAIYTRQLIMQSFPDKELVMSSILRHSLMLASVHGKLEIKVQVKLTSWKRGACPPLHCLPRGTWVTLFLFCTAFVLGAEVHTLASSAPHLCSLLACELSCAVHTYHLLA